MKRRTQRLVTHGDAAYQEQWQAYEHGQRALANRGFVEWSNATNGCGPIVHHDPRVMTDKDWKLFNAYMVRHGYRIDTSDPARPNLYRFHGPHGSSAVVELVPLEDGMVRPRSIMWFEDGDWTRKAHSQFWHGHKFRHTNTITVPALKEIPVP